MASKSIDLACDYISEHGYPETAKKYFRRMMDFASKLGDYPSKFPICKRKPFKKLGLHCAIFENTYVFVYKIDLDSIIILDVIHSKRKG